MLERTERAEQLMQDLAVLICGEYGDEWLKNFELFMKQQPCWQSEDPASPTTESNALTELYVVSIQEPIPSFRDLIKNGPSALQRCFFNINFTDWFGDIHADILEPGKLTCFEIDKELSDRDLIDALGRNSVAIIPFSIFLGALNEPGDGSPHIFGESDETHVFYVKDETETVRAVAVACKNGIPIHITAHSLRSNARWNKLRRVFALSK
jgi:hypothetical protein